MSPYILALDVAGAPHRWINVRDAAHYYATDMIAWAIGTNEFVLRGGTQRATGLQSMIRASSIIAIKGKDFIVRNFASYAGDGSASSNLFGKTDHRRGIRLSFAQ